MTEVVASSDGDLGSGTAPTSLSDELLVPGRTLVFCDDTEICGQPTTALRPDLRILVAVQIASDCYPVIDQAISAALKQLGVSEFHATDIASGNGGWAGHSEEDRVSALTFIADQLEASATRMGAMWLPKAQFPSLKAKAQELGEVGVGYKHGLKRAFVRSIISRLAIGTRPAMLWLDQDTPLTAPKRENWPEGDFLIGGGPIAAPSHLVRGLQLADLAAWSIQRFLTKRAGFDDGTASAFDAVAASVVAGFPSGLEDLRGEGSGDWAP